MGFLEFLGSLIDALTDWRFYLCFLVGVAIACLAITTLDESFGLIVAGVAIVVSVVIGIRWERG